MKTMETQEAAVEAGDRLAELYRRHAPGAARLAYLLTGDRPLAQDIVHDAFVRLFGRFQDLRSPDAFEWYLRRTVVNLANSYFRHAKVERAYREREGRGPTATVHPDVESREDMWRRLLGLPERQRAVLVLRFYEDLTEGQIAEVLNCPIGTVKSLMARGLERLRGTIASEG